MKVLVLRVFKALQNYIGFGEEIDFKEFKKYERELKREAKKYRKWY